MESSKLLLSKNLRKQEKNEVIIDIDDRTLHGLRCYMETGITLVNAGYHIELWYASGMKNPHIHIKNIPHITELSKEEGKQYRLLFYERYAPEADKSLANPYLDSYHPIAAENKAHYKYKTLKTLRSAFNTDKFNFCETDLYRKAKQIINPNTQRVAAGEYLFQKIAAKISILYIADKFGITPYNKKLRECPFHPDKNPSLSLNEELGLFHCFGCNVSGNIIKFYAMLKQLNPKFIIQ